MSKPAEARQTVTKVINVWDLEKTYGKGTATVRALRGVGLAIGTGEFVGVIGPSGSGKTTLLSCLGGILRPSAGKIEVDGVDVGTLSARGLASYRRRQVGFVFQSFNLVPSLTALENVAIALRIGGNARATCLRKAGELLEQVGLADRAHHLPEELSGGEKQRVSIARALANDPKVILADEPTANLDTETAVKIVRLLEKLARSQGKAIIVVTHDERMIDHVDKVYRMMDGRLAAA